MNGKWIFLVLHGQNLFRWELRIFVGYLAQRRAAGSLQRALARRIRSPRQGALCGLRAAPCLSGGEGCAFSRSRVSAPLRRRRFSRPAKWISYPRTETPVQLRALWINSAWHMTRGLHNLGCTSLRSWCVSCQSPKEITRCTFLRFYFDCNSFFISKENSGWNSGGHCSLGPNWMGSYCYLLILETMCQCIQFVLSSRAFFPLWHHSQGCDNTSSQTSRWNEPSWDVKVESTANLHSQSQSFFCSRL